MKSILFLVALLCITTLSSQQKERSNYKNYFEKEAKNPAIHHSIISKYYDHPREIIVQLPLSYRQMSQKRYPVLYLLDGERNIKSLTLIANTLARKHKMPEILIVAIPASTTRQQDYTPNDIPMHSSTKLGNAKTFTQFLKEELTTYIDTTYRTVPYRILSGHSRGGLFALNDLLAENAIFQAHFAFSPALWAGNYKLISKASQKLEEGKIGNHFFYVNAGGEESLKIRKAFFQFESLLNIHNPTRWEATFHEHDSHGTTPIPGHYLALRKLYANWDKPWELYDSEGLTAVKTQHDLLSKEFGYRVIPDENDLNNIGYSLLKKGEIEKAITAFQLNTDYHPHSANAFYNYAKALDTKGALDLALSTMEKVLSLNKKPSKEMRTYYQALRKKVSKSNK
ncbi:alpha/beta hydrolase [Spongiimicrobium salis]|uniref:alpha/beta hydrolase n=1 Tax=Spongiimicrobium salis TaxID=1667022 RepID=UPI00374CFF58